MKLEEALAMTEKLFPKFKRYMVFAYAQYYPGGGMGDVDNSFDNEKEAMAWAKKLECDYVEVFDREEGVVIWEK